MAILTEYKSNTLPEILALRFPTSDKGRFVFPNKIVLTFTDEKTSALFAETFEKSAGSHVIFDRMDKIANSKLYEVSFRTRMQFVEHQAINSALDILKSTYGKDTIDALMLPNAN